MESNQIEVTYFKHPVYQDYACDEAGNIYSLKNKKIRLLKQNISTKGYFQIIVYNNEKQIHCLSHRFILECRENEILPKNIDIDHIDRNPKNNSIDNLRKVSRTTNNLNRLNNEEVDLIPDDKIEVIEYNFHEFEDLYFSPSTNCLYKISDGYKFRIPFKACNRIRINDKNKILTSISFNKLRKILDYD